MQTNQYQAQTPHAQAPNMYNNMYPPNHQAAPLPYPAHPGYNQPMGGMMQPQQQQRQYNLPQNLQPLQPTGPWPLGNTSASAQHPQPRALPDEHAAKKRRTEVIDLT